MADGQLMATLDFAAILGDPACWWDPSGIIQWACDSCCVLFNEIQKPFEGQNNMLRVMPAAVSGSHASLSSLPFVAFEEEANQWSADGQYVSVSCLPSRIESLGSRTACLGSVWHVMTGRKVLSWASHDGACPPRWAPCGSTAFCSASASLVSFPAKGCEGESVHQPYYGPQLRLRDEDEHQGPSITFSPSGHVFVGAWQNKACQLFGDPACWLPLDEFPPNKLPQELGHVMCDLTAPACSMIPVATSSSDWLTESITWHPGPRTCHIYAITTASGGVYLMDSKQHRCIHKWSCSELAGPLCAWRDAPFRPSWSPDGTQLLVLGSGCICMLTFAD